jgi:23S rRNA (cytosine1962-C5)-methyltransferase
MMLPRVQVDLQAERALRLGHPWIYAQHCQWPKGQNFQPGDLVKVFNAQDRLLGFGYANPQSQIPVRMLYSADRGRNGAPDEAGELSRKADRAWSRRQPAQYRSNAYRLIWSEADGLPGFVADRFGEVVVLQCLTAGAQRRKLYLIRWLAEHLKPRGIYERSAGPAMRQEGLSEYNTWVFGGPGEQPTESIHENGLEFEVVIGAGQKTGFYLDQRSGRRAVAGLPLSGAVLDLFSYTGGFSLAALRAGATHAIAVDASDWALEQALGNARRNRMEPKLTTVCGSTLEFLNASRSQEHTYQCVVCDPPSYAKSTAHVPAAHQAYIRLHQRAAERIEPGGYGLFAACSHHIRREIFVELVIQGCLKAGRKIKLLDIFGPDNDHPERSQIPETRYLTNVLFKIR